MKKTTSFLLLLALLLLSACAAEPPEVEPATQETAPETTTASTTTTTEDPTYYQTESDVIFDFAAELPGSIPRGAWTVNRLVEKYDVCERAEGQYRVGYAIVMPYAAFPGMHVSFEYTDPEAFAFFRDDLEEKEDRINYPFGPADMDLEMDVKTVCIISPDMELPRGLRVGCTKAEVFAAYPESSGNIYVTEKSDTVFYNHEFRDVTGAFDGMGGWIAYWFDEDGILWGADIAYRYFDLH